MATVLVSSEIPQGWRSGVEATHKEDLAPMESSMESYKWAIESLFSILDTIIVYQAIEFY